MNQNVIDNETQEKLDAFIKQEEGDSNDYKGLLAIFITLVAIGMRPIRSFQRISSELSTLP
jgi:hypothetical protein